MCVCVCVLVWIEFQALSVRQQFSVDRLQDVVISIVTNSCALCGKCSHVYLLLSYYVAMVHVT